MLEVSDVTTAYGSVIAITNVSLNIRKGETAVIIGRNGAGKTTLLRTIAGFLKPIKGRIIYNGEDITNISPWQRAKMGIRYIAQDKKVFSKLTVKENLELASHATRCVEDIDFVLNIFPRLKVLLNNKAGGLSGGERQMLLIARGLIGKPNLLLLDEPTEGLMAAMIAELTNILQKLKKDGHTMIIVEQNLSVASQLADKLYIMREGIMIKEITEKNEILSMTYEKYL